LILRHVFFTFINWNLVLFIIYINLPKFPVWSPAVNQNAKKARALTGSTFGIYIRFKSVMQTKQEPVDS